MSHISLNSIIERELNKKTKPRYLGPFQIVRQTKGGSYVLQVLDGTVSRSGIAAFRLIPYKSRDEIVKLFAEGDLDQLNESDNEEISMNDGAASSSHE